MPSPRTPCILTALLCNPGCLLHSPSTPCIRCLVLTHLELDWKSPSHSWLVHRQATRTVPGNFSTPYARFWGPHRYLSSVGSRYLPSERTRRPALAGPTPRLGPTHPTPTGHPKPQVRESRAQPPKLGRVDVLIHFSQTSSNVMKNWCRPVAQPSPS